MKSTKSANDADKYVGARVKMRRLMMGMSQGKLGDALNLTFQQVQKYEKGANRIGASRLLQLSEALDVPVAFFFEGAPKLRGGKASATSQPPEFATSFLSTADGLELARSFMVVKDPHLRKTIVQLVKSLASVA